MKQFKHIAVTLLLAIVVISCKKETTAPALKEKKIARVETTFPTSAEVHNYKYDAQGRLIERHLGYAIETFTYISPTEFTVKNASIVDPSQYTNERCILNDKGAVVKSTTTYANGTLYHEYNYVYNSEGILIQTRGSTATDPNFSRADYKVENGIVTGSEFYVSGALMWTTEYVYDMSRTFKGFNQLNPLFMDAKCAGVPNKHPLAYSKSYNPSGDLRGHYVYTNTFDANENCISYGYTNLVDGQKVTYKITYQ